MEHHKGPNRKTQRLGRGKCGAKSWWGLDFEAGGLEHLETPVGVHHSISWYYEDLELMESGAHRWYEAMEVADEVALAEGLCGPKVVAWPEPEEFNVDQLLALTSRYRSGKLSQRIFERRKSMFYNLHLRQLMNEIDQNGGAFERLRAKFLKDHGSSVLEALEKCGEAPMLSPAPLNPHVQELFLSASDARHSRIVRPAFHGTAASNHNLIFEQGLLIPGAKSGLCVAHGSAHGNGVYTAALRNPCLSKGFTAGCRKMLVCGVADDAAPCDSKEKIGQFDVTSKSEQVYHVGDAMVIFNHELVAPLFVAEWQPQILLMQPSLQPKSQKWQSKLSCDGRLVRAKWEYESLKHRRAKWLQKQFRLSKVTIRYRRSWSHSHEVLPATASVDQIRALVSARHCCRICMRCF